MLDCLEAPSSIKSAKSHEILWKFKLIAVKVIQDGANWKCICTCLLVINSNFGRISDCFKDIDAFSLKVAVTDNSGLSSFG